MKKLQQYTIFSWKRLVLVVLAEMLFMAAYVGLYHLQWKQVSRTTEAGVVSDQMITGYSDTALMEQSFFIHEKCKLNTVHVRVGSLEGVTVPTVNVSIQTKLHDVLFSQDIPVSQMQANEYMTIDTGGLLLSGKDRYYLVFSCIHPNGDADVVPGIQLCTKNHVNDILYFEKLSLADMVLDAVYEYTTVRAGIHEGIICIIALLGFMGLFLLRTCYIKYVPVVLAVFAGLSMWYKLWRQPFGVNLGCYDGSVMQRGVSVMIVLLCIAGIVCTVIRVMAARQGESRREYPWKAFCEKICRFKKPLLIVLGILVMLVIFLAQLHIAQRLYQKNGFDVTIVYDMAKSLYTDHTLGDGAGYLSLFPNNRALVMVFYVVMKLFGTTSDQEIYWHLVVLNIISVDVAIVLLYQIARKLYSRLAALAAFCFSLILFGFSGWIVVPYTDTIPMWIPVMLLWLYMKSREVNQTYIRRILLVAIGLLTIWGYYMKPQCVIVMIAIGIVEIYRMAAEVWRSEKQVSPRTELLKKSFYNICTVGVGMLAAVFVFQAASKAISVGEADYSVSVPMSHFLMMGAAENGSLGSFDYDSTENYTYRYGSTEEKNDACRKRFSQMLENYGFAGYVTHLWEKAQWVLGDGSFAWMGEGAFFALDFNADKLDETAHKYRELYGGGLIGYDNTKKMHHFGRISAVWLIVLLLCLIPFRRACRGEYKAVLYLAAMGCVAFTMIFEGRPRYIILYLPFFCILAGAALSWICGQGARVRTGMQGETVNTGEAVRKSKNPGEKKRSRRYGRR